MGGALAEELVIVCVPRDVDISEEIKCLVLYWKGMRSSTDGIMSDLLPFRCLAPPSEWSM